MLNRIGFQTNMVPLFFILISYLFWRGWRQRSMAYFIGAGVALGASQYTYISARILPAIFAGFVFLQTILAVQNAPTARHGVAFNLLNILRWGNGSFSSGLASHGCRLNRFSRRGSCGAGYWS